MLKAGDKAPDFRVKSDDGRDVSLSEFRGKRVLLFFFPKANTTG
jgi:peroxiredoxin Q/BCP